MYKCIYCNSTNKLTESDIISYALTGAKVTRRFVCQQHNQFTNDHFERIAIGRLDYFRNALGLTERKTDKTIKYSADVTIDGVTIKNYKMSDRASLYEDNKRLSKVEHNGAHCWIGNIEKLKQISGVDENKIKPLNQNNVTISKSVVLEELFSSEEMLLLVAKTAYEWYCFIHEINEFQPDAFQDIVNVILKKRAIDNFVQVVDERLSFVFERWSEIGAHSLLSYADVDGYEYVIFCFWGVVTYKIRIRNTERTPYDPIAAYDLCIYHLDGEKTQQRFDDTPCHFIAISADEAIKTYRDQYITKLVNLMQTTPLTPRTLNTLVCELRTALSKYKQKNNFCQLIDYEEPRRILALRVTSWLRENEQQYDYSKGFDENIRTILNCGDVFLIERDEDKAYVETLQKFHDQGTLSKKIETDIEAFNRIFSRLNNKKHPGNTTQMEDRC